MIARNPLSRRRRTAAQVAGVSGIFALLAAGILLSAAAASAAPSDTIITVTVAPAPADPGSGGSSGGGSSGGSGGSGDGSTTPSDQPSPSPSATPGGGTSAALVSMSGLSTHYVWSLNPVNNAVRASFTVHNGSKSTFDSTARFWVEGPVGNRLADSGPIAVSALKPDRSRTIESTLSGLGQWTGYHVFGSFTPPKTIDGIRVSTMTRDAFIVLPPLLVGGFGLAAVSVYVALRFLLFRRPIAIVGGAA